MSTMRSVTHWQAVLRTQVPWRHVRALLLGGVIASLLAATTVRVSERVAVGPTPSAARELAIDRARQALSRVAVDLRAAVAPLVPSPLISAAGQDDEDAQRQLFARLRALTDGATARVDGITVYGAEGEALAWAGRSSEATLDPVETERWFLAPGSSGALLFYVVPIVAPDGRPGGAIVSEGALEGAPSNTPGAFELRVAMGTAPVTLWLQDVNSAVPVSDRFDLLDPRGQRLAIGTTTLADQQSAKQRWVRASRSVAFVALALTALLACAPLIGYRSSGSSFVDGIRMLMGVAAIVLARGLLAVASPADFSSAELVSGSSYGSSLAAPLLASPLDFLLSALLAGALGFLATIAYARARVSRLLRRWTAPRRWGGRGLGIHLAAAACSLAIVVLHRALVWDTVSSTAFDMMHLSLHPWNWARIALQLGLVAWHATAVGCIVLVLNVAQALAPVPRGWPLSTLRLVWFVPALLWLSASPVEEPARIWSLVVLLAGVVMAVRASTLSRLVRRGSQAVRLLIRASAMVVAALACYPTVFAASTRTTQELIESRYAPQALNQRQTIQRLLQDSLTQIDALPFLSTAVTSRSTSGSDPLAIEAAFQVWEATSLAQYPVTSSVELYGAARNLVGRFAFNLPDDLAVAPQLGDVDCGWSIYEEVSPFFAEQRRVLHAGRAVCVGQPDGSSRPIGAIVVHAMLDFENLPFIASQSPYGTLLRPDDPLNEGGQATDLEYVVYGWSGRPLYTSAGSAWVLEPETLRRIAASRSPTWLTLTRDGERFRAYALNDRGGIYVLGVPVSSRIAHLVNAAELVVLASMEFVALVLLSVAFATTSGRRANGAALFREVRASFYRKLFLAFVAASALPVVTLALLTSSYVASELRAKVELEAVRTAATARRVVEDFMAPRSAVSRDAIDDNLMVWVSRLIDQDVNVFRGSRLQASSDRNLFASGVLVARTPADAYASLVLGRQATALVTERVGAMTYLTAATPLSTGQFEGFLTVPLTLRQQDSERQIDTSNRLVVLGALLFILAGAAIGYSMAERIADPINRLTRATRRIARGHLDEDVVTTAADELGRLVHDFNRMARELRRQQAELERTHRIEAWAEMARQVAHEIKNPLTPIQLNAEHLRRVHHDRGRPLSPVLEDCVDTILRQVALLRTIASEFSNFSSTPVVRSAPVPLSDLVEGIIAPYRDALAGRVLFTVAVDSDLPPVLVDGVLLGRALTNLVENALHAMPVGGRVSILGQPHDGYVRLDIRDTGVGMEPAALARAFEPYFSTKTTGTGLGLPIAKRNVELSGGTISMASTLGQGTTVTVTLPTA